MNRRDFVKFLTIVPAAMLVAPAAIAKVRDKGMWSMPSSEPQSALRMINAKRVQLHITRALQEGYAALLDESTCDCNDEITRKVYESSLTAVMGFYAERKIIYDFCVVCNETNNPPKVVDTGFVMVNVFWKTVYDAPRQFQFIAGPTQFVL